MEYKRKKPRISQKKLYSRISENHKLMLRQATIAHKSLLRYYKDHKISSEVEPSSLISEEPQIKEWLDQIRLARKIAENEAYTRNYDKTYVHYNRTGKEVSNFTKQKRKHKLEHKRQLKVFQIPDLGVILTPEDINFYKSILQKNSNSGMDRDKAISISTEKLRQRLGLERKI